eukprot:2780816-Pyramimonas_sp.AAC.1
MAKEWEEQHASPVFWGAKDRECDRAGWIHQMLAHYAAVRGLDTATLATDLDKFYERVCHFVLFNEGEGCGFPVKLLRAACGLYAGPRAISFRGCVSGVIRAVGTVLAGCSLATSLARVLVYRLLTTLAAAHPSVHIRNVIDDISAQSLGTGFHVVSQLGE